MKLNEGIKNAYARHSVFQSMKDRKERFYYFEIDNLQNDYKEMQDVLQKYQPLNFDFVASCLHGYNHMARFFSGSFTGRFSINKDISLSELKAKLIEDGYVFMRRVPRSGPLCLNDDFSEPLSAKVFKIMLPFLEIKLWFKRKLLNYNLINNK